MQIVEPVIAFNLRKTFRPDLRPTDLFDNTRHAWKVGKRREKARYAFAVYKGIVQEVYTVVQWFPQNTTLNIKHIQDNHSRVIDEKRWEFIGNLAPDSLRKKYIGEDVSEYFHSKQNPVCYINC